MYGFAFALSPEAEEIIQRSYIKYLPIGLFWLIISFVVSFISLKKVNKNYILYAIIDKEKVRIPKIKQYYIIVMVLLFFLGSGLEINRGLWHIWLETYLLFICIIITIWQIWKYIFEEHIFDPTKIYLEGLKSVWSSEFFLKYLIVILLISTVYLIFIVVIYE